MAVDPQDLVVTRVRDAVSQFVEALTEVWPQDLSLKTAQKQLEGLSNVEFRKGITSLFTKQDDELVLKKDTSFWNNAFFVQQDAVGKFQASTPDIQEAIWDHVKKIADASSILRVYSAVPDNLMKMVTDLSTEMSSKMKDGKMDMSELNPLALGQRVLSQLSPDDLSNVTNQIFGTLGKDPTALVRMMSSMQAMIPSDQAPQGMSELNSLVSNLTSMDPSALMKMLPKK